MEFDPNTKEPLIYLIDSFIDANGKKQIRTYKSPLGGTMRLGGYDCNIRPDTLLSKIYGTKKTRERHRHRYEVNNDYREVLEANGMSLCGLSPDSRIVEMVEIPSHPWFIATQAHPELKSRPNRPHPLFKGFVEAALAKQHEKEN